MPYSFSVSSRSSLLFAPDWKPFVMMSNASSALFAMPVRIICDTARVTPPRSWSNVFDTVSALPDIAASVLSDAPRMPSMSWMTDFMASLMSAESPMLLENSLPAAVPARAACSCDRPSCAVSFAVPCLRSRESAKPLAIIAPRPPTPAAATSFVESFNFDAMPRENDAPACSPSA